MQSIPSRSEHLISRVRDALVGDKTAIAGPFGTRRLVYADYTASGRALDFIEAAVAGQVLPTYANTHTETSYTGLQTTRLREGARAAIRRAVGADERHAVVFCGSGATAAVNKLASVLGLCRRGSEAADTVVFVGPYEHHSNDLVWRESGAKVVRIPLDAKGRLCMATLERELTAHKDAARRIGSFSAASNVTGLRTDMRALARLLHRHGAEFLADYAAAAPYLPIDIGGTTPGAGDHIDAIFLSPHKFVGGPGASGVLIADRRLLRAPVPSVPGGGTVAYVTARTHRYVADEERREEAGTPNVVGDIRAGLVMQLKADIGAETIEAIERATVARVLEAWAREPDIEVLGPADPDRLAIFSFNVRWGARYLHPNLVVALLNDLFGIQARGGCSCAGPYAHDLLGIDDTRAAEYDGLVRQGLSAYRPGWVRLNFNFFLDAAETGFIIEAVKFIARHGHRFLVAYTCDAASGRWRHGGETRDPALGFADLCAWGEARDQPIESAPAFAECLAEAERIAATLPAVEASAVPPDAARWFSIAGDAA
jgi:selenocysteine lyase/cysteine desulfurase